jgi:hypothetical protein
MKHNPIKDRQIVINYLKENFDFTLDMAVTWIQSTNANFGLTSPEDLIQAGRVSKVMAFLIAVKEGY